LFHSAGPALNGYRVVLKRISERMLDHCFVYLACGALRLARFNTASANHEREASAKVRRISPASRFPRLRD